MCFYLMKKGKVLLISLQGGVDVIYESVGGEMFDLCVNK